MADLTITERKEPSTLDEAISHAREVAERQRLSASVWINDDEISQHCIQCANEHEQLAEWLEELKAFKENKWTAIYFRRGYKKAENDYYAQSEKDRQSSYDCGYEVGYGKAIDNFSEAVKTAVTEMDDIGAYDNPTERILEILDIKSERLKAGDTE